MSIVTGQPVQTHFAYTTVTANSFTIPVTDFGIFNAAPTAAATWNLPALSAVKKGFFIWIYNATAFSINLVANGGDLIDGASSLLVGAHSFITMFTGTQWGALSNPTPFPSGTGNTAYGVGALADNTTGIDETAFGFAALQHNTTGNSNTAVGFNSLQFCSTGGNNTAEGTGSGANITAGNSNTAIGFNALTTLTTGSSNTCVGAASLQNATSSGNNCAFGVNNMAAVTTGANNAGYGQGALPALTTGSNNIAVGRNSGSVLVSGSNNIYLGTSAVTVAESGSQRLGDLTNTLLSYMAGSNMITAELAPTTGTTIAAADLNNGIVIITGAATISATGASLDALFTGIQTGNVIKVLVVNTQAGASAITTASSGITLTNAISVAQNDTRLLYFRRTGAAAYTVY